MDSILTVTTAATSYDLTTLANVKAELSASDGANDAVLKRYISSASQAAMQYCNRVFAVETVSEQFLTGWQSPYLRSKVEPLQLARWPIVSVTSVVEDSVTLTAGTDYLVDATNGQITRLMSDGRPTPWLPLLVTVVYVAGYATVPADLEDGIIRMVTKRFLAKGRDPSLRQQNIPGVLEQSFWISTGSDSGNMTPDITDILDNYRVPVAA